MTGTVRLGTNGRYRIGMAAKPPAHWFEEGK
jgi:hypothetical protein